MDSETNFLFEHKMPREALAGDATPPPDELRALAASLFASQEEERRRVARELHNGLSQKLAMLEIEIRRIQAELAPDAVRTHDELDRVQSLIATLSQDVSRISHSLFPSAIEDLGLPAAIRSLVEDFRERDEMVVTFESQDVPDRLPLEISTGLYRVAQETLRRVPKQGGKTPNQIFLKSSSRRLRLTIHSSEGFNAPTPRFDLGLIGIGERVRMMRGVFSIESKSGQDATVTVDVPLP